MDIETQEYSYFKQYYFENLNLIKPAADFHKSKALYQNSG